MIVKLLKGYFEAIEDYYKVFWRKGIPVDVINMDCDFSKYKLVVAPMLYMIRPGVAERLTQFVKIGGTLVTTYFSGLVDENDLCFLGGFPGPLREVTGIWAEEIDTLYDTDINYLEFKEGNELGANGTYKLRDYCDVIHAETAEVLATYKNDYYDGMPALTVNNYGNGKAYYVAARTNNDFDTAFFSNIINNLKIKSVINTELPLGVTAQMRTDGENDYIFIMNFNEEGKSVILDEQKYFDMLVNKEVSGNLELKKYDVKVLKRKTKN